MKKLLALGVISFSLSASLAEARFFLGVEGGYEMSDVFVQAGNRGHVVWGSSAFENKARIDSWTAGANLGTEHQLNDLFGLRWYFGVNYGENTNQKLIFQIQYLDFQLGADALLNFVNTGSFAFGVFAGIGGSFSKGSFTGNFFKSTDETAHIAQAGFFGQVGLTFGLGEHNRIDLTARIPIMNVVLAEDGNPIYNPLRFTLGYKFIF